MMISDLCLTGCIAVHNSFADIETIWLGLGNYVFLAFAERTEFSSNRADIDKDWDVDLTDFAILASQWQQIPGEPSADINPSSGDGFVDTNDLTFLVENWLWGN